MGNSFVIQDTLKELENIKFMIKIYIISDPRDVVFNPRYIGITARTIEQRLGEHISHSRNKNNHKSNWIKKILSEGVIPKIELVDEVESPELACEIERSLIRIFRNRNFNITNACDGGEGRAGCKISEETRQKIKDARAKQIITEEAKLKIGLASKNRVRSEESKRKQSEAAKKQWAEGGFREMMVTVLTGRTTSMKGRPMTEEHKKAISEAHQRRKLDKENTNGN
jgi:hypothetical protein